MSHFRRNAGRFSTHTATEAYQRQLATPVHKWKKAWVSPTGLQPESSYKICKWIRVPKDELDEPEEDVNDDGMTPAADDDDDMENGDENEGDEDEGEGEGGEEGGDEEGDEEGKETDTPANEPALEVSAGAPAAPAVPALDELLPAPADEPQTISAVPTLVPTSSMITSTEGTSTEGQDAIAASALLGSGEHHTELPRNAIEISNIAPGHTEQGAGDLGGMTAGVEIHVAEPPLSDVDMLDGGDGGMIAEAVPASPPATDEGLVHGEMEQPEEMDDGAPPPEVERS